MTFLGRGAAVGCLMAAGAVWAQNPVEKVGGRIDLPSSKQITGVVPGDPQRLNSLPVAMAVSPDGRYVVTVNGGYGSYESRYMQSLAVLDTKTGKVEDFPDERTLGKSDVVLFSGLAFAPDGKRLYGTVVSVTDLEGDKDDPDSGAGIQVYGFTDGKLTRERVLKIPLQKLAAGKTTKLGPDGSGDGTLAVPYPAAIAVLRGQSWNEGHSELIPSLLVADNLSDDVLQLDITTGKTLARFDLSESNTVPGTYPAALALSRRMAGGRLWGFGMRVKLVELDLMKGHGWTKAYVAEGGLGGEAELASDGAGDELRMGRRCMCRWAIAMRWRRSICAMAGLR